MNKFKVGDRVRIKSHYIKSLICYEGIIVNIDDEHISCRNLILFDKSHIFFHDSRGKILSAIDENKYYFVDDSNLEHTINDCKLNRALYPDYEPKDGYLFPKE